MDFYNFLLALIFILISGAFFIIAQRMPNPKKDEFLSRYRVYFAAVVVLIVGIIYLFRSF